MHAPRSIVAALLLAALPHGRSAAQGVLTLSAALRQADRHAYVNRIASAAVASAAAQVDGTMRSLLPAVRLDAGWSRSTDPLAAFGFLLDQRGVTPAAFDPAALNQPAARSDLSTGAVLDVPLVDVAAWESRRSADHSRDAALAGAEWIRGGARLDVLRAYFGAILARDEVAALDSAYRAATAHVRDAESAAANGMVTRSDVLLATVRQDQVMIRREAAGSAAALARRRLALAIGTPLDTVWTLPASLPIAPAVDGTAPLSRADLAAAGAQLAAARADRDRARLALLPRLGAFGRYDWHDAASLAAGRPMWTVGVAATWSPFTGGAELAEQRRTAAEADAASARADAAAATAETERLEASAAVGLAEHALVIVAGAVEQASEAHRIVGRKYAGGLASVSELLDAQSAELEMHLALARARYDLLIARAEFARASGQDLSTLATALDAATGTSEH